MSTALRALAPPGLSLPPGLLTELEAAYATPPRAYHSLSHVEEVARLYDDVRITIGWEKPREVFLAVLFHDAVYVAGQRDNEAKSADLADDAIVKHLAAEGLDGARVRELILLTARHGQLAPGDVDRDAALFLDCDMAILAADEARFYTYEAQIAEEHRAVPPALFQAGRRAFLERILQRPCIFLSPELHRRLEPRARKNLARALDRVPR
jgi:predicted metal-dependent HD superfamily phosphohydrolase